MHKWIATLLPIAVSALSYDVQFWGLDNPDCLKALERASDLYAMQERPPVSLNALRYRVEADIPNLIQALRAFAYYDASVTYTIDLDPAGAIVTLFIHSGDQYKLASYQIYSAPSCTDQLQPDVCCTLAPAQLGLQIEKPALSVSIVNAELQLLTELARCGHPLAQIEKRRVIVDMERKNVDAAVCVDEGPVAAFGPSAIFGLRDVNPRFIEQRIDWKEGQIYDADLVEHTQKKLLSTDLFSSVLIAHSDALDEHEQLPMRLRITEAKHKQITIGAFYATVDGPGATFSWTNRNVRGMGEQISIQGSVSSYSLMGTLQYKKPDFWVPNQSYRALASTVKEVINPYTAFTYRFANYIERKIKEKDSFSAGLKIEHINVSQSASNGSYFVLGVPLFAKCDRSNDPLNPTRGYTLVYSITPYQTIEYGNHQFAKQRFTATGYLPIANSDRFVLALRAQFGSIAGADQSKIPLTKLFLGGSEDDLRGYRYKTVSPLNSHNEPLGGKSAIFSSLETRIRITSTIGLVPFFDFGTVSASAFPKIRTQWYKSVGLGVRYFSFFGPLRFDIGFPLDPRPIDPTFRIYASVGQTF